MQFLLKVINKTEKGLSWYLCLEKNIELKMSWGVKMEGRLFTRELLQYFRWERMKFWAWASAEGKKMED